MFEVKFHNVNTGENLTFGVRFLFPHKRRKIQNQRVTVCIISALNNRVVTADLKRVAVRVANGIAECHSYDRFDKSEGRKVALTDALKHFAPRKDVRREFWKKYFETYPVK